jgi:hypothetical protein
MADIHFFYGRANGNAMRQGVSIKKHFRILDFHAARTFSRIAQRLRETDVLRQMVSTLNILFNTQTGTST